MHLRLAALALGLSLLGACSETDSPVLPAGSVACTLELDDGRFRPLLSPASIVLVTEAPRATDRIGRAGLAIVHAPLGLGSYYAYDLACPYEGWQLSRLRLQDQQLVCPQCGSHYELYSGLGRPTSGPARSPLGRYRVLQPSSYRLTVTN